MDNKRILILYNSIGLGHKSIAENIGYWLAKDGYEIKFADILQVQGNWLSNAGAWLYHIFLTKVPSVWSFLYTNDWFSNLLIGFRTKVGGRNFDNVKMMVDGFQPDIIISTHTVCSSIVGFLKQKKIYSGLFGIAFSDFHLHPYWLYKEADFYLVNIEDQKKLMEKNGISGNKIFVCGMTLQPKTQVDLQAVRVKLGIDQTDRVVLVSSGSQGTGIDKSLLLSLSQKPSVKIIVVCGKNKKLFEDLSSYFLGSNIIVLGFYKPMDELYAIADICITKPGGLSTSEALRWDLPILVSHVLPGQEELNFDYLQDKGLVMPEPITIEGEAEEELDRHEFRHRLSSNFAKTALFPNPKVLQEAIASVIKDSVNQ